jgi:hypothetical protein
MCQVVESGGRLCAFVKPVVKQKTAMIPSRNKFFIFLIFCCYLVNDTNILYQKSENFKIDVFMTFM